MSAPPSHPIDHPTRSHFTTVDGLRVHFRYNEGDGPAVLLLPGGVLDSVRLTWKHLLDLLPGSYRVFAPDLPGYGQSDAPPEIAYTTGFFAGFVERFMDRMGLERAVVCGSSMSGAVALELALRCPERVERLVLSGAYGLAPRVPLHRMAFALSRLPRLDAVTRHLLRLHPQVLRALLPVSVYGHDHVTDELVEDAYAGITPPNALLAFFEWFHRELTPDGVRSDYTDRLEAIRQPVLLLHGAHDRMMPVRHARRAAERLPHATLFVCDTCGHLVPREAPEAVREVMTRFLEGDDEAAEHAGQPE